tara:strand:+ start:324 stop:620 length:297 start_codon:yes stop_codon:yes gene_type:complete
MNKIQAYIDSRPELNPLHNVDYRLNLILSIISLCDLAGLSIRELCQIYDVSPNFIEAKRVFLLDCQVRGKKVLGRQGTREKTVFLLHQMLVDLKEVTK